MSIQEFKGRRVRLTYGVIILLFGTVIGTMQSGLANVTVGGVGDVGEAVYPAEAYFHRTDPVTWSTNTLGFVGAFDSVGQGASTLLVDNVGSENSVTCGMLCVAYAGGTVGDVTVSGSGARVWAGTTYIGYGGMAQFSVSDGASVVAGQTFFGYKIVGILNVSGADSLFSATRVTVGWPEEAQGGIGTVNIRDGGLVKTAEINLYSSSFIRFDSGGKLALACDASVDTMSEFVDQIGGDGLGEIGFWSGDSYLSYTNFTEGVDYAVYRGTGDLDGYAVLAEGIPEPSSVALICTFAMGLGLRLLLRRRY